MDLSNTNHLSSITSLATNPQDYAEPSQRPSKVQKLSTPRHGYTGDILNIPVFMGSPPRFPSQQNQQEEHLQHQSNNYQEQVNSPQESPRTNPHHNNQPRDEGPFCWYKEDHVQEGIQLCQQSLIGKILSEKFVPKQIIYNSLMGIWGNPKGFHITEVEGGFYHITMDLESDIKKAVKGNPWTIRNVWFSVQQWDREKNPKNIEFHKVPVWLQLWGLPLHCKTTAMGKHLGSQIGMVEDTGLYDFPDKARIVKIKVQINTSEPIQPGIYIGNTKDGIQWIDFRYENLPLFCFNCGLVGHNEDNCSVPKVYTEEGDINPRGPWLRANSYGRRVNEKRDPRFHSNPSKSMSGGCYSPIPKAMLDMLAKMKLAEESTSPNGVPMNTSSSKATNSTQEERSKQGTVSTHQQTMQTITHSSQQTTTEMAGLISKASQRP
jgi:hypothetical protein